MDVDESEDLETEWNNIWAMLLEKDCTGFQKRAHAIIQKIETSKWLIDVDRTLA